MEVPVLGAVAARQYGRAEEPLVTVGVHGVQRVEDATVVYLSVGSPDPDAFPASNLGATVDEPAGSQSDGRNFASTGLSDIRLVDARADEVLTLVADPSDTSPPLSAFASGRTAMPTEPGVLGVLFAVLPLLAPGTETVDVQVARGAVVPDVPVGDGPLLPAVDPDGFIPLGTGWPEIDAGSLRRLVDPEASRHDLAALTEDLDGSRRTSTTTDTVAVDVAADVLFAFDSADLSPDAVEVMASVADEIAARGAAGGRVEVIGHTDSSGTDAYNEDLSLRRAQAVADVLVDRLGTDLDVVVEGLGEREPVADNATDEGRQANRRVTVGYELADGEESS